MFRGDPSRSAATIGGTPLLNLRWRVDVESEQKTLQEGLRQQEAEYRQHGFNVLAGLHPLAVGDVVVMRTTKKLMGVEFGTGKRSWEAAIDEEEPETPQQNQFGGFNPYGLRNMSLPALYGIRIWDDAAYGTMSSDGKLVFALEKLNLGLMTQYNAMMFGGIQSGPGGSRSTNVLAAYEVSGGKLSWHRGGPDDEYPKDGLQDAFFLGPPLPLRGQLYAIAEIKDEIRLVALDAANGHLLWSQQLAMVEQGVMQDPVRRLAGVSPSYADGVLICPTGSGCVVAVDLATRSLLWGYVYPHGDQQNNIHRWRQAVPQIAMAFANYQGPPPRWLDGTAVIVKGRVLLTPAEADMLYCLNLADGKPAWKEQPRSSPGAS